MKVLFYSPSGNPSADRLVQTLDQTIPEGSVEVHRHVTGLIQRLRMPSSDLEMLIVMPESRHELFVISSLLSDMRDIRLILVLPDMESETIAMAHSLRPRFVAYSDGDYSELKEVLKKIFDDTSKGESALFRN